MASSIIPIPLRPETDVGSFKVGCGESGPRQPLELPNIDIPISACHVGTGGPGMFSSLEKAAAACPNGGVIVIEDGDYETSLVLTKSLTIVAAEGASVRLFSANGGPVLVSNARNARVRGVSLLQGGGTNNKDRPTDKSSLRCVEINGGDLCIELCEIVCETGIGILVYDRVRGKKKRGILFALTIIFSRQHSPLYNSAASTTARDPESWLWMVREEFIGTTTSTKTTVLPLPL